MDCLHNFNLGICITCGENENESITISKEDFLWFMVLLENELSRLQKMNDPEFKSQLTALKRFYKRMRKL